MQRADIVILIWQEKQWTGILFMENIIKKQKNSKKEVSSFLNIRSIIDFEKSNHFHPDRQLIIDNQSFKKPGLSAENLLDLMERLLRELCVGVKKLRPDILMKVK